MDTQRQTAEGDAYQVLRCGVELIFLKALAGATQEQLLVQFQGMIAEYERTQIAERCEEAKSTWRIRAGRTCSPERLSATDT